MGRGRAAPPPLTGLRAQQTDGLWCHELRSDRFGAEQVNTGGVVTAVADREIAADGDDEVVTARREDGAGIADDRRSIDIGDDLAQVT